MAISDTQKLDYLYKKIGYGVASTDAAQYKSPSNEQYASPLLVRGDNIWVNSGEIPLIPPTSSTSIVGVYTGTSAIKSTVDSTVRTNRAWLTGMNNWIGVEFGPQYQLKVYVDSPTATNPSVTGTRLYPDGSGNNDSWFFDYQSGILSFSDTNIPTALTAGKVIFVEGYQYVGGTGLPSTVANAALLEETITRLQDVVDGAPALLDTLNELASAIGNDPNFITTITNSIAEEISRATNVEANISATITSISYDLSNVETSLSTNITLVQTTLENSVSSLTSNLANVAFSGSYNDLIDTPTALSAFTDDVGYATNGNLTAEIDRATAAESSLSTALSSNVTALQDAIAAEQSRAEAAESSLQTNLTDYINTTISSVLDGAPELLDTLNELAAAVGDDPNFIGNITASISAEISRAEAADSSLAADLVSNVSLLQTVIADEHQHHIDGDATLQAQIDQEILDRIAGDVANADAIAAEVTRATEAEVELQNAIVQEGNRAQVVENTLFDDIDAEAAARIAGDEANTNSIAAEISRATAAEISLANAIAAEQSRAETAELNLQTNLTAYIDTSVSNLLDGAPALLDTLNELAAAIGDDPAFFSNIATSVSNEQIRATTAETSLATDLAAEIQARQAGDDNLYDTIQTVIESYQDADTQEEAARIAGDAALQTQVDTLSANLTAEISRASTIESNLESNLTAYIDTSISNLLDGAPALLDTLNELAAAIGDDDNFVVTINNKIDTKANTADLANVAFTGSYSDLTNTPVQTFQFGMASVWPVVHNRNTRFFVESVFDSNGQKMIVPVNIIDENSFEIVLTQATSGHVTVFFG